MNFDKEYTITALFHNISLIGQSKNTQDKTKQEYVKQLVQKMNIPTGVDNSTVLEFISGSSSANNINEILNQAGLISLGFTGEEPDTAKSAKLSTLFTKLSHKYPNEGQQTYQRLPLQLQNNNSYFPSAIDSAKADLELLDTIMTHFTQLPANMEFEHWITTADAILRKYCINIPFSDNVSLYHHSRLTAALASNLATYHGTDDITNDNDEQKHILIKGEVNGIQKFIFQLKSNPQASKGQSKRLRGRSFVVQLISDAMQAIVLKKLDLSVLHVLSSSGGKLLIIAPNIEKNRNSLLELQNEIENIISDRFQHQLALSLAWKEASNNDLIQYQTIYTELSNELQTQRYRKFKTKLNDPETDFFEPIKQTNYQICRICNLLVLAKGEICQECNQQENIGAILPKSRYLIRSSDPIESDFSIFDLYYRLSDSVLVQPNSTIIQFNELELQDLKLLTQKTGLTHQLFSLSLPKSNQNMTLDFDAIADTSNGVKRLGILKADVDNLGSILSKLDEANLSLVHFMDISFRLDLFFSGYTAYLAGKNQFCGWYKPCAQHNDQFNSMSTSIGPVYRIKDNQTQVECNTCDSGGKTTLLYSVFAGGDDILYVGPWDLIIEYADQLNQKFHEYTANNPNLTLSAGINMYTSKFPLARAVELTDKSMELAKSHFKIKKKVVKNSIAIFNEVVVWKNDKSIYKDYIKEFGDFGELLEGSKFLADNIQSTNNLYKSSLHVFLNLWQDSFGLLNEDELEDQRLLISSYRPLLAYYMSKRYSDKTKRKEVFDKISTLMPWIRIPVSWVSLYLR